MCDSRDILPDYYTINSAKLSTEQELTRTRLGYEAILFLEQTGDLRFKERIYQGETYRFSLMENDGRRILKVTDSRGAILIGQ